MKRVMLFSAVIGLVLGMSLPSPASANHWNDNPGMNIHWADHDPSFPRGYVYWADRTEAEWPVYSAAVEWDKANNLDAIYVGPSSTCPSEPHCVSVTEQALGVSCSPLLGETHQVYSTTTGHLTTETRVALNSVCSAASNAKRRTIACHELGHSIGFDEQTTTTENSCMVDPYVTAHTLPSTHDFQSIASVYNHND